MGVIHKKSRTTGKRPRRTGEKVAQNTGTDFLALRLGVVLSLPILDNLLFGHFSSESPTPLSCGSQAPAFLMTRASGDCLALKRCDL